MGDPAKEDAVQDRERRLLAAFDEMLARPDFLFPLVAAERQYREHYYGLSSAALLEDLFYDAFANFLAQYHPAVPFERPGRGQKGWDYRFEEMEISHKVGLKPQAIAVLWDATKDVLTWTFQSPVAYLCAGYQPGVGRLTWGGEDYRVKALSGNPAEQIGKGHRIWLVDWPVAGPVKVLWHVQAHDKTTIGELLPFAELWPHVVGHVRAGFGANRIEVLRSMKRSPEPQPALDGNESVALVFSHRPGVSLLVASDLVEVPVKRNNRAVLLAKETVAQKMASALSRGLFVSMPLWFRTYAADRPPDLYLTQRAEFDALFSPAERRADSPRA